MIVVSPLVYVDLKKVSRHYFMQRFMVVLPCGWFLWKHRGSHSLTSSRTVCHPARNLHHTGSPLSLCADIYLHRGCCDMSQGMHLPYRSSVNSLDNRTLHFKQIKPSY